MQRNRRPSAHALMLLRTLSERSGAWHYGYELSLSTGLKSGTLYPILMRLSERGLLESKWQNATQPGRPPRHVHRLSAAGVSFASEALAHEPDVLAAARGVA